MSAARMNDLRWRCFVATEDHLRLPYAPPGEYRLERLIVRPQVRVNRGLAGGLQRGSNIRIGTGQEHAQQRGLA